MEDIENITKDRNTFHQTIYVTLSEALIELQKRRKDKNLLKKIDNILGKNIPEPLKNNLNNAIMFRQVATPNYEIRSFIDICSTFELNPIFFEYGDDKFTSNNSYKHSLGQLRLHKNEPNKKGENIEEKITIVDFPLFDGKKLNEVKTIFNEDLISFHKKLFNVYNIDINKFTFYDVSTWVKNVGLSASIYYEKLMYLFVCNGILFENFLLSGSDANFTKNVFLPSFIKVYKELGIKPLIVPIPPMDIEIEEDFHWHSHNFNYLKLFINKYIK